ncbi:hypothetical protein ACSBR2_018678 [Camellia fascicularis]
MANNNGHRGIRCATIVRYRECQRSNAADDSNRFLNAAVEESHPPVNFYCAACSCHRSLHCVEEVLDQLDPAVVEVFHSIYAASAVAAACHHQALTPPPPPPAPAIDEENLSNGKVEQEPPKKKRRRVRFSDVQIVEMVKYATVELEWSLEGHGKDYLGEFCEVIEITPRSFKVWMKNNKNKYLESKESSSNDDNGGSFV